MRAVYRSRRCARETTSLRRARGRRKFRTSSWTWQKRLADSTFLKPAIRPRRLFDSSMVLLQMVIEVAICAVSDTFSQFRLNGSWVRVMPVGGNSVQHDLGDRASRVEERLGSRTVPRLTQIDVDQVPIPIYRAVEVSPAPFNSEIGLVTIPTPSHPAAPLFAEGLTQHGCEFGFPLPYGFMGKDHAAIQEHFGEVP